MTDKEVYFNQMRTTKIEWTERTWNPVTGCTKISKGCEHCYAETMSRRLYAIGNPKYKNGFQSTIHPEELHEPKVFGVIRSTPQHNYQILTKRAERMAEYFSTRSIPHNAWLGVTVEIVTTKSRIDYIRKLKAPIRFISCEPLLEDLGELDLTGINWVIVGGESGVQARPMKEEWVLNIKKQADTLHIPFFFKQWGTWSVDGIKGNKKTNGKLLQGVVVQNMPTIKK